MSAPTEPREVWSRRLAIGLPVLVLVLVVVVANQIGGVLIAKDLREDYARLVEQADALEAEAAAAPAPAAPADEAPAERPEVTVNLVLDDLSIAADVDEIPAWARVTFHVTNEGALPHDATTDHGASALLDPGESDTFTVEAPGSGTLRVVCAVPGHEAGGMALELPIAAGEPEAAAVDDAANGTAAGSASPENAGAYDGDKPPLELRDPLLPPAPDATVHDLTWTIEERVMQVAPDVWQEVWTFEGQAPGPTLRVKVGDAVCSDDARRLKENEVVVLLDHPKPLPRVAHPDRLHRVLGEARGRRDQRAPRDGRGGRGRHSGALRQLVPRGDDPRQGSRRARILRAGGDRRRRHLYRRAADRSEGGARRRQAGLRQRMAGPRRLHARMPAGARHRTVGGTGQPQDISPLATLAPSWAAMSMPEPG